MPSQLIFTSAPRTLTAGQSGYGTVARSMTLRDALVQRLEQLSYYEHPAPASASASAPSVICACRMLDLRGTKYHVLTRIQDAGLDFTSRTNHLAHHLVFEPHELAALPSPALILRHWDGWRSAWSEEPRFLDDSDWGNLAQLPRAVPLPARTWQQTTGDAGSAAALVDRACAAGCFLICDPGHESHLLDLFAESLQVLDPDNTASARQWQIPFTTCLQTEDRPGEFRWRGCPTGSAALLAAQRTTSPLILLPETIAAPANELADLARRGRKTPTTPTAHAPSSASAAAAASPTKLQKPTRLAPVQPRGFRTKTEWIARPDQTTGRPAPSKTRSASLLTPRLIAPAIGAVVLLLLGGFVWPGWFLARQKPAGPSARNLAEKKTTNSPAPGRSAVILPDSDLAPVPVEPKPKPGGLPKTKAPPPPAPALEQLQAQMDAIPTCLVFRRLAENVELPPLPELETMIGKMMTNVPPLSSDAVECWASANSLRLSPVEAGTALKASLNEFSKLLLLEAAEGTRFTFNFQSWFSERKPIVIPPPDARPGTLTLLLRPAKGVPDFAPFRLVVVPEGDRPRPIALSKSFLRADQENFESTLDGAVRAKLARLTLPPAARLQLRPFIGNGQDLCLELEIAPANGMELNFAMWRSRFEKERSARSSQVDRRQEEISQASRTIDEDNARDLRLGVILGHNPNGPLADFASFARTSKKFAMDRTGFLGYLRELFQGQLKDGHLDKLKPARGADGLKSLREWLAEAGLHEQVLKQIPPDYFVQRWQQLGEFDRYQALLEKKQALVAERDAFQKRLDRTPRDLAGVSHVSLFVIAPDGRRLELIRFADPPPKAAK